MTEKELQADLIDLVKRAISDHVKGMMILSGRHLKSILPSFRDLDDSDVNLLPIARMYRDAWPETPLGKVLGDWHAGIVIRSEDLELLSYLPGVVSTRKLLRFP